ncbi:Zinc finger DHHC-type palmitoyltransferase [Penicillium coprophilum]|uniref:Zinc finger DHHC-type palmitoyltransferase n=1 Tax=Penicillium coprophilum TaxID=36646 RepID=UPI00239B7447|nr:Zinc finger DHHC-type palmitoyltransferase [Penicillium coprophilum]KAJ5165212.1 Zinc finger DHHC-type palmitoyltransferase [Penicillium coprophilum]
MASPVQKRVNVVVSRLIPPVLLGAVVYASYAVTKPLCIDYLIHPLPSYNRGPRAGAGAAIIAIYYVLLIPMVVSYLHLYYHVMWDPGYLPLGEQKLADDENAKQLKRHRGKKSSRKADPEKTNQADADVERGSISTAVGIPVQSDGWLESFYTKDVFVCQEDGRPLWCSTCGQYKTDRAHHCRELGRCVRKMDHYCPWVGGVVSETSLKFFIQFVSYTAIFCTFVLIVSAYYTAEIRRETGGANAYWCVCIGLSGLFAFFTAGMTLSSVQMGIFNITTIENLNRRSAVWTLAVRVPEYLLERLWAAESPWAPTFRMVSYPLQTPSSPTGPQTTIPSQGERHVFAILHTLPGENPFDLGSPLKNLQQVMGYNIADWLLPIKQSPCADHSSNESHFAMGPVVTRLKLEAGLVPPENGAVPQSPPSGRSHQEKSPSDQ